MTRRAAGVRPGSAVSRAEAVMAFVAAAPIAVAMTDKDLRFLKASPAWLADFGLPEEKLIGFSSYDLAPETREKYGELHRRSLAGENVSSEPERIQLPNGETCWMMWDAAPWRDDHGQIGGLLIISRNVTAQKEAEQEARRQRAFVDAILQNVPAPMVVKNQHGRVLMMNRAMEELYGFAAEDHLGRTAFDVLPIEQALSIAREDEQVLASPEPLVVEEVDHGTIHQSPRLLRKTKVAFRDGEGAAFLLAIAEDITERRRAEDALKEAVAQAEAANVAKSEFLANMSHEIRTPLNGVLGLADALARMPLTAEQAEIVRMILSSGRALTGILSDVLDLAKAEAGQLELQPEPFSLRETIGAAAFLFETVARDKGLQFSVSFDPDGPDRLVGDHLRIRQIVSNLISNAVKFTATGEVAVHARALDEADGRAALEVTVRDTGPGFSEAVRAKLFGRFEQGDGSITRRFGGTGLGLSIASALAQMMGGEITCSARPGKGATFVLTARLEVDQAGAAGGDAVDARPALQRPLRVLLAEDHEVNQKVVQLMLTGVAELVVTADGRQAVDALFAEGPFDVVLMDTQMPVMDGLTAMTCIREEEARRGLARTPIVSLTANAMSHQVDASLEAGADAHLAKPITADGLYDAINRAIEAAAEGPERAVAAR